MLALQKPFDIGRNLLALPGEVLALDKFLRCRNRVSSRALGDVHAGVGHADDVLDRKTVHRETRDPEASGDLVFAQHGIGRQPLSQALGQYLSLFGAGLRHQDDELIAAVARHDVRLPGLLLEQAADPSQHEIALEVAHGVVDLLKFIEVNEHHGKRPPRARSAFPLRRKSFPEEAARLDTGQAVGNGLLLQLLEDESIVQRRGQQVGQRIQDQNVLRRERILTAALNVEDAEQRLAVSDRNAKHRARIRKNSR